LTQCVTFLSRELVASEHPYSGGKYPSPYCKHCWRQNTSGCQYCLHFSIFYSVASRCVFLYHKQKKKMWGNSNFKAYYLQLDFMEMVSDLDRSHKTISVYWHSSDILKVINNISTAWVEVSVKCWKECGASLCEHRNVNICCSSLTLSPYI